MVINKRKLLLLIMSVFSSTVTNGQLIGLYYGEKVGLTTVEVFIVIDSTTQCVAEVFQPLKGQIVKVFTDTLLSNLDSQILYRGKKIEVIKRTDLYVKQRVKVGSFEFGRIKINYSPDQSSKHNEYKNRAYLFEDKDRCINILKERIGALPRIYSEFDRLNKEYKTLELAKSLPYNEFLIRYGQIRTEILDKMINH